MKVVAIVFLMLLNPILAMDDDSFAKYGFTQDDSFTQLCHDRIREGEKRIKELEEETETTLQGKKDIIISVKEEIQEKRGRLSAPESFLKELDALLKLLRHPEDLLTVEQRRALIGFPIIEHFQQILNIIDFIGKFIKKWELLVSHAESLKAYANRTIWYGSKWTQVATKIDSKLTKNEILRKDLLKAYELMRDFRKQEAELENSSAELTLNLQKATATLPQDLEIIDFMFNALKNFFHVRGRALWEIIRYSDIVIAAEEAKDLAEEYENLPLDFCFDNRNFIRKILSDSDKDLDKVTILPSPIRQRYSPSKIRSTRSLPISQSPQKKHPSLRNQKLFSPSKTSHSAPQSVTSSPLPSRIQKETSKETFKESLSDAFVQLDQWESYVDAFKKQVLSLVHAKFIVAPLSELLKYYNDFKPSYIRNLGQAYDILSPKAYLDMPGQPLVRIPQKEAREICSLTSNGPLCFKARKYDEETTIGLTINGHIGGLVFKKRRDYFLPQTREKILQFWFETSFGIPSDPVLVSACDGISFYVPNRNQQLSSNSYSEKYITNPEAWSEKQNLDFITVHKTHKGENLESLLNQITAGQGSFKQLFNKESIGLRLLFGLSTGECASPENFELVENGNIKRIVGKGDDSFLQPSFMLTKDKNHHLVGHNIFYLFPIMDEKIPESVKNNFTPNNIPLRSTIILTQLAKTQRNFDEFISKYKLTDDDELPELLEIPVTLSKANVLGLTLTARKETIPELLQNDTIIAENLKISDITYGQIFQKVRPLEYDCYQQLLENAQNEVQTTPIFFTQIIPSIIKKLRKIHEATIQLGEIPLDPIENLDSFEDAAKLYREKITEYLEAIETWNGKKTIANSKIENLKGAQTKNEKKNLKLQKQLNLLTQNTTSEISPIQSKTTTLSEASGKQDITIEIQEAGRDSLVESNGEALKIEELRKQLKKATEEWEENDRELENIPEILKSIDLSLQNLHARLSPENLFKELKNDVPQGAQAFFEQKYKWAEENHIFYASVALKAWENLFDPDKPVIYETLTDSLVEWASVPMLKEFRSTCDSLIDSNHSIQSMAQDLIKYADISSLSPSTAIEFLDHLLTLVPHPQEYHPSWQDMVQIAKECFFGMTPHVQSFFYFLGLQPEEEASVLQNTQLLAFEDCQQQIKMIMRPDCEQELTPGQFMNNLWRQLWLGSLKLNQEDQLFFDGLINFFSLPLHGSQLPAGLATNPESKGGIFELRYEFGDHYPLVSCVEWVQLFRSPRILPAKIRQAFLSRARHLLLFQFLDVFKEFYPDISFHAWYPKTVVHKITLLQEFLQTHLNPTFNETMLAVWPELYFIVEEKFKARKDDLKLVLSDQIKENPKLIPVENNEVNLYRHNMLSHLQKWEDNYLRCIGSVPLSPDNTTTEWFTTLNTEDYGPKILALILDRGMHFTIDLKEINPTLWSHPKILTDLLEADAPLNCLRLVAALRGGVPFSDITLKKSGSSYQISGLKGNVELIGELIQLFPNITSLSLADNELWSLKPLVPSLKVLSSLTSLDLSNNPIHNPAPLMECSQLTDLNIENTEIPAISLNDLKKLIAREKKVKIEDIKQFENITSFNCGLSGTTKKRMHDIFLENSPLTFLKRIRSYCDENDDLSDYTDEIICILERLGEDLWFDTLALEQKKFKIPCDTLFNLLQDFDPRKVAYKLLFAIKFTLPHGTNPDTLSFVSNTPSMQADCLTRLDVTKLYVSPQFLSSLPQFENLAHLSLTGISLENLNDFPILRQLRVLNLKNNNITTLKGLHTEAHDIKFPELNIFNLASNKICTDIGITYILELGKLTYLNLCLNELTQMPSLGNLRYLQGLDLRENKIPQSQLNSYKNSENFKYTPQKK